VSRDFLNFAVAGVDSREKISLSQLRIICLVRFARFAGDSRLIGIGASLFRLSLRALHDAMLIEPSIYLNAMLTDFRVAGGTVRLVHFEHASQLQLARDATGFLSALVWRGDFHPPSFRC